MNGANGECGPSVTTLVTLALTAQGTAFELRATNLSKNLRAAQVTVLLIRYLKGPWISGLAKVTQRGVIGLQLIQLGFKILIKVFCST